MRDHCSSVCANQAVTKKGDDDDDDDDDARYLMSKSFSCSLVLCYFIVALVWC